jgi:tetratricopeptide (TPR) repeat protein
MNNLIRLILQSRQKPRAIEAGSCSIATAGIVGNNTVTCNFGLTQEQLNQLTEAAVKGATQGLQDHIEKISNTLGVTQDAARTLLKIVGDDPNIPDDKRDEALTKVASDFKRLRVQVAGLNPENPTARALVQQAKFEIDAGHLQRARELWRQATQAEIVAVQEARSLSEKAAEDEHMLGAASSTALEAGLSLAQRDYRQAAELFAQAADYVPKGRGSGRGGYLVSQAGALYRQGDERGDNAALQSCIEVYGRALTNYPRSQAPLDWAQAQNGLGDALVTLGERESGTARLNEAVATYRAALEERTRDRAPLAWAQTQNSLGNALERLGERESGRAWLKEAVAAYRAALEERTRERVPLDWAATQTDLGRALAALGTRESGTERLDEAVAAYRAALQVRTREQVPLDWAQTQNNYGVAGAGERDVAAQ